MIVIGLTGYARSGKDTVADSLVSNHGFVKLSLATPLKQMLTTVNPIISGYDDEVRLVDALAVMTEDKVKATYPEYRRLLQRLGTEGIRGNDPDFWIKAVARRFTELRQPARVVIPDVRFPNEADFVRSGWVEGMPPFQPNDYHHGEVWRINRPAVERMSAHPSELGVDRIEHTRLILNNGTTGDLDALVSDAVTMMTGYRMGAAA